MAVPSQPPHEVGARALARSESVARAREVRKECPRRGMGAFVAPDRDPVAILERQNRDRVADLVPIRIGRMLESPFAYYRGAAAVMAKDLAAETRTGLMVVVCGDAHLSNFGLFASPERRVVFDLNDFDEAAFGPWEWDVKRLAASVVVAGRVNGLSAVDCTNAARATATSYRLALANLFEMTALERFFFRVETDWLESRINVQDRKMLRDSVKRAQRRTSDRVLATITTTDADGEPRLVDQVPIMQHDASIDIAQAQDTFDAYRRTVRIDVALLLDQFRLVDVARRVVGVNSVGTRAVIALLLGPAGEPLFMQMKEASESVVESYGGVDNTTWRAAREEGSRSDGWRVVAGQRVLQAVSDPFLGWVTFDGRDYYCRQFRDMKGSIDLAALTPAQFIGYGELCGAVLARGHAQSREASVVSAYLGRKGRFEDAIATWADSYADQVERDYEVLRRVVRDGRLPAEAGV